MIVVQRGVVDITPEYNRALRPVFCVSEGDKTSRQIVITVMQNGEAFLIPSGSTVYIIGKKPDNNIFTYRCSHSGSDVTFNITEQMSAASGIVLCELQINLSGEVLGSANFVYWTESTPLENGSYSESDLNIFLEAIAGAERLDNFYAGIEDMVAQAVEQIQIMPGQVVIDPTLLVSGAAADAKATGDIVRAFMNALITETTEESTIATCDDAAGGLPLKRLVANIAHAQAGSGDPSPDNVRAISGYTGVSVTRTGKNIITLNSAVNSSSSQGITYTAQRDTGTILINGTATNTSYKGFTYTNKDNAFNLRPFRGLRLTGKVVSDDERIKAAWTYFKDDRTYVNLVSGNVREATFVIPDDAVGLRCIFAVESGETFNNVTARLTLTIGDQPTEEDYVGTAYPITFPTEAGTVYGGTLNVYSDGSGTLTVDRDYLALPAITGTSVSSNVRRWYTAVNNYQTVVACDSLIASDIYISDQVGYVSMSNVANKRIVVTPQWAQDITTIEEFNAALVNHPINIVVPLATPTTYALSAAQVAQMLNGNNCIWTDAAGTLTAEYYANTSLYVDKKVNAQRNMIAGVEEAMIATQNYSVNDLLIVGNTLYKVTAAISSGAALVVGTNVTETTVAEQLLALA